MTTEHESLGVVRDRLRPTDTPQDLFRLLRWWVRLIYLALTVPNGEWQTDERVQSLFDERWATE